MNKKVKTILFVLLGVLLVAGIGVGGYFLISKMTDVSVYNLKMVTAEGAPINNMSKYLLAADSNEFKIGVEVEATSGSTGYYFKTSNPNVAKVIVKEGNYFVQYYNAGSATISVHSSAAADVYDSFKLDVYDNYISNIVIDNKTDNTFTVFGDGTNYVYNYVATGILEDEFCNNMLTRVVDNYDKEVLESITINQEDQTVSIKSKLVTQDSCQIFYLQTYYVDDSGNEHVVKNFTYFVNVIGYRIDDMQLLVSENYLFRGNGRVYLGEGSNKDNAFLLNGEKVVSNIVLSKSVQDLYFKIRVIYSNKTFRDVSFEVGILPTEQGTGKYLEFTGGWTPGMDYWFVQVDTQAMEDLAANDVDVVRSFKISYQDEVIKSAIVQEFNITFKFEGTQNYQDFIDKELYAKVVDKNGNFIRYEYIYWDTRFRRIDTQTDANGYIIGFDGEAPKCDESKNIII